MFAEQRAVIYGSPHTPRNRFFIPPTLIYIPQELPLYHVHTTPCFIDCVTKSPLQNTFRTKFLGIHFQHANARIRIKIWSTSYYTPLVSQRDEMSLVDDDFKISTHVLFPYPRFQGPRRRALYRNVHSARCGSFFTATDIVNNF